MSICKISPQTLRCDHDKSWHQSNRRALMMWAKGGGLSCRTGIKSHSTQKYNSRDSQSKSQKINKQINKKGVTCPSNFKIQLGKHQASRPGNNTLCFKVTPTVLIALFLESSILFMKDSMLLQLSNLIILLHACRILGVSQSSVSPLVPLSTN